MAAPRLLVGRAYEFDSDGEPWVFLVLKDHGANFEVLCLTGFPHLYDVGSLALVGVGSEAHLASKELT